MMIKEVDDPNADLVFQSSDFVQFRILGAHLKTATDGFPVSEHVVAEEDSPIPLQETGQVLELLFQFVHPPTTRPEQWRQPDVNKMGNEVFFALAEAAEKYTVFAAMSICFTRMDCSLYAVHRCKTVNHTHRHG
ncbi:hypothetical protein CPB83DRAFT_849826 [Crepidotus variabilis]|uniref:BTB domain-containing protein n=1 Tax=Crepidotus variabilis TaxID=179855 RepID=A0A9P6ELB2_9AGAR|nr:hypothetical protein CPB83DRAFT_849826 [Crepidotus variabilis]